MKKKLEDEGLCGGVWKYMSGERIDEHRSTSRTVCHRCRELLVGAAYDLQLSSSAFPMCRLRFRCQLC